ncbi:PIR Superfamily Protein [Plasmodium ovale curtisi]|uniref:PIR Superfamily Protein n=1 Tax=Plasmodium ovale curtisi TaxID=864141 RepID=A0A1A8WUH6_PLAOA|nr:PIR Superfamily Protein [Plasmodium ovale curtisi]SBT00001.1 PIR Superfamily Protein [Plasmodium ovale curtisi]
MATPGKDTNKCELPSEKYYNDFDSTIETTKFVSNCNTNEKLLSKYPAIKEHCLKLASNIENLKNKVQSNNIEKECKYLKNWMYDKVFSTVQGNTSINYIGFLYKVWNDINEALELTDTNKCTINFTFTSVDHFLKWKKMEDYIDNYVNLESTFKQEEGCIENCEEECVENCKEDCTEKYCMYFLDIINIHNEFENICTVKGKPKCPTFWTNFEKIYKEQAPKIEPLCTKVYEELGLYKIMMSFGDPGEETYIEQYESLHTFSFFEKLIGYSIKKILSKSLYYSKYIVLPILLILLFYFFMKKLSFFGSKIAPKADDMRKMWRNVQGVTNPATLLNPMKPPGGGNKMGLPYMPK